MSRFTHCFDHYRYLILVIALLCLTSIGSNYIVINFTFICMLDDPNGIRTSGNETYNIYDYSQTEKSAIIWSVAVGTTLGCLPINHLCIKFGARLPFFVAVSLSAISTALIPLAASLNIYVLLIVRFIQGLTYAADFAVIGVLCVHWTPMDEYSLFIAVLTAFSPVSTIITNSLTAFLCTTNIGWASSYYFHAVFGLILAILWLFAYTDEPAKNRFVSEVEYLRINKGKSVMIESRTEKQVPYKEIIRHPTVLMIWFNAFCDLVTVTLLLTYAPQYFNMVLGYDIPTTGLLSSLNGLVQWPFKFACAFLSDKLKYPEGAKMIFFNSLALGLGSVFCACIGLFPVTLRGWGVAFFMTMITLTAASCGGFYKCAVLVARQHSHFVIATIQFMKCISLFVAPALVALIVPNQREIAQWRIIFFIQAAMMLIACVVFIIFQTDKPAAFTGYTKEIEKEEEEKTMKKKYST